MEKEIIQKRLGKLKEALEICEEGIVNLSKVQRIRIDREIEILKNLLKKTKSPSGKEI